MRTRFIATTIASLAFCVVASGQAADTPFQVRVANYLDRASAYVNVTNSGASATVAFPAQNGQLCANFYVNAANGNNTLLACCSCPVLSGAIASVNVLVDLLAGVVPPGNSATVKVLASTGVATCDPKTVGTGANVLATGLVPVMSQGFGTNLNPIPFTPSTLSAAELTGLTTKCGILNPAVTVCPVCRVGAN